MELISRKAARAAGQMFFYTGKPCRRQHIAPRYVVAGNCRECVRDRSASRTSRYNAAACRKWREQNRERYRTYLRIYMKTYYQLHKEKFRETARDNYARRKARRLAERIEEKT